MAAPTDVRVEATSTTSVIIRWTYAGAASVTVYRSTDGVSYAAVSGAVLPPTTTSYTDDTLSPATKYWYKLTDDAGATFSSVVTVWTHVCLDNADGSEAFGLPRFAGETDPNEISEQLDNMAQRIEEVLGTRVMEPQQCARCPVDGALVLDCSSGCKNWIVVADEDINSISMQWCDGGDTSIDFIIPPNTTRAICGFDTRFGFSGDECFAAPIVSGSTGRTVTVGGSGAQGNKGNPSASGSKPGVSSGTGRGGGGGGGGCNCVPSGQGVNNLTIKSCTPNNSLSCSSTKSLQLKACGGLAPYTWSKTGGISISTTTGPQTTVTPPTNTGSGVAGTAYAKRHYICVSGACSGGVCINVQAESEIPYTCNDVAGACQAVSGGTPPTDAAVGAVCCPQVGEERCPSGTCPNFGTGVNTLADLRTAPMISAGCNPCGLQSGSTVSVTDALGTVTTVILTN